MASVNESKRFFSPDKYLHTAIDNEYIGVKDIPNFLQIRFLFYLRSSYTDLIQYEK